MYFSGQDARNRTKTMYTMNNFLLFYLFVSTVTFLADNTSSTATRSYCEVLEPTFKYTTFNFTKLSNGSQDIVVQSAFSNQSIRMQLCAPLIKKCNGQDGYQACLIKNNTEIGIGKEHPKIISDMGRTIFNFTGDYCEPGKNYTLIIIMKCDYKEVGNSHPFQTEKDCNIYMIWLTAVACVPEKLTQCVVEGHGFRYDLRPLTKYSDNYIIPVGNSTTPSIILNVCHSVVFEYGALCKKNSGVCLRDSRNSSHPVYTNLGNVQKPLFLENGQLKLEYEEGDICKIKDIPHIKTTITFICDFKAEQTVPEYVGGSEECHYQLIWKTAAACTLESLRNHSAATAGKCTVTNPLTNFTYNLQSLMNVDYSARSQAGNEYEFSICKPHNDASCKAKTGICLTKSGKSMGIANSNLIWQQGGPFLNYTGGDSCGNGQNHSTLIAFLCGPEGSSNKPRVMEEQPCQLIIHWSTELVCEKRMKCATDNEEFNLSPLIRSTSNYIVKVNKTQFHINICRPLVPTPDVTCAHGSAVCKTTLDSKNRLTNETSLGFPEINPQLTTDGQIFLFYHGGSPCPEKPDSTISSKFIFLCDYSSEGVPEFIEYSDCTYVFQWKTSIVCGAIIGQWSAPCIVKNQLLSQEYDLSPFGEKQEVRSIKDMHAKKYQIKICGGIEECNNSIVCQGSNGYGSLANVIFDYSRNTIKLKYSNGSKCFNSSYTSEVRLMCNESLGIGEPKILWEMDCNVGFEWRTNVVCTHRPSYEQPAGTLDKHTDVQESSSSHVGGTVTGIIIFVIGLLATLWYFRSPDKRARMRSCWNSCTSRRSSGRVQYCRVDTTEEARLLDASDPAQCQTDSDDELLGA